LALPDILGNPQRGPGPHSHEGLTAFLTSGSVQVRV